LLSASIQRQQAVGSSNVDHGFPGFHSPTKASAAASREIVWSGQHTDPAPIPGAPTLISKPPVPEAAIAAAAAAKAAAAVAANRGAAATAQVTAVVSQKGGKTAKPADATKPPGEADHLPGGDSNNRRCVWRCRWWISVIVLGLLLVTGGFTVGLLLPKLLKKETATSAPNVNSLWYRGGAKAGPAAGAVTWACEDVLGSPQVGWGGGGGNLRLEL
jgi:hypothetical protein